MPIWINKRNGCNNKEWRADVQRLHKQEMGWTTAADLEKLLHHWTGQTEDCSLILIKFLFSQAASLFNLTFTTATDIENKSELLFFLKNTSATSLQPCYSTSKLHLQLINLILWTKAKGFNCNVCAYWVTNQNKSTYIMFVAKYFTY